MRLPSNDHKRFDAPAPITRPRPTPLDLECRSVVRIAWLIARFIGRRPVRFELYGERFGHSLRTFRRNMAALRDAGLYVDANLRGDYHMICFRSERDAA